MVHALKYLQFFSFLFFAGREVDWVQCDGGCNEWFHMLCVGLIKSQVKPDDDFICKKCKKTTGPNDATSTTATTTAPTTTATTTTSMTTTTRSNRKTTAITGTTNSVKKRCVRNKDDSNVTDTSIGDIKENSQQNDHAPAKEKEIGSDKTRSKSDSSQLEVVSTSTVADSTTSSPAPTASSTPLSSTTAPTAAAAKKSTDTKSAASTAPTVPLKKKKNQQKL